MVYWFARASIRILKAVFLAIDRRHNVLRIPSYQRRTVFLKSRWNIHFSAALCKDAHDSFAESICLFDLPVYPRARMSLLADEDDHGRCPRHFHSQQSFDRLIADFVLVQSPLVRAFCTNRAIAD